MKFFQVKTVEETIGLIESYIPNIKDVEKISLWNASGRVVAQDVIVRENVPSFRRSSVDGYAVKAEDTFGASESMPAFLSVKGEVRMGEEVTYTLQKGEAVYVPTGGMLPNGSDTMVMIEHCEQMNELLNIYRQAVPNEHVVFPGEDLKEGEILVKKQTKLRPQEIGALASQGIEEVPVFRRPIVGYLSTGDEIVSFNREAISTGEIRDSNALTIGTMTEQWGYEFVYGGIVPDDESELKKKSEELLQKVDCLVLSGGSSVGTKDYSVSVIDSLGKPGVFVHGVAVKPGKPTILSCANDKAIIGLPGHPASAMVIYMLFGRKILTKLTGEKKEQRLDYMSAISTKRLPSVTGRTDYIRVKLTEESGQMYAEPVHGKSGLLFTMVASDGLLEIPSAKEGIDKGEVVKVIKLN
ncbi:molybdopterin molybdotransferase MoeA [Bacillus massiliigorillae]|uniref:molybdopterin molybdotransferase MoeA n=1 Tax=Bacillus massiliigorillae TaxID=1243664 RepID=UPI0003A510DD|nr:gephyrin-like molybdotransferase Glp [Bacillus massiliigorillae]